MNSSDLSWLFAPNLACVHGFSTRHGGISTNYFSSLNLGGSDDTSENILSNRKIALEKLHIQFNNVAFLKQIHSADVLIAQRGQFTGDALVSNEKNIFLAVSAADCYPILFYDKKNKIIGAAHAGWKGTLRRIVKNTVEKMVELGANKDKIEVAIGQGICCEKYEVGEEIIELFINEKFPKNCFKGKNLDLLIANEYICVESGIPQKNIWKMNRCTSEKDFFSHRRDQGKTGRMWGIIGMKEDE